MNSQPNISMNPMAGGGAPRTSTLAIVSLIAAIVGIVLLCTTLFSFVCAGLPLLVGIVAVITGHRARKEINRSMGQFTGNGLAVAGLIMGYGQIVISVVLLLLFFVLIFLGPAIGTVFSNIVINI